MAGRLFGRSSRSRWRRRTSASRTSAGVLEKRAHSHRPTLPAQAGGPELQASQGAEEYVQDVGYLGVHPKVRLVPAAGGQIQVRESLAGQLGAQVQQVVSPRAVLRIEGRMPEQAVNNPALVDHMDFHRDHFPGQPQHGGVQQTGHGHHLQVEVALAGVVMERPDIVQRRVPEVAQGYHLFHFGAHLRGIGPAL